MAVMVALLLSVILPGRLTAQQIRPLDRERAVVMLHQVQHEIEHRYYDPTFHGLDLDARADSAEGRIDSATTLGEAMAAIAQFAQSLNDSHTFFIPPATTVSADYGWDMTMIGDSCLVTRVKPGSDAERQGVRPGDAVLSVNGYRPTRGNIWQLLYVYRALRPQPGLRVLLQRGATAPRQLDLAAHVTSRKLVVDLTGADGGDDIARLIWDAEKDARDLESRYAEFGDSVLAIRLPSFEVTDRLIKDLMGHAQDRRALILDLRDNAGGAISALRTLVGQMDSADVMVAEVHERDGVDTLTADGKGAGAFRGRVIVLVNSRSASASELLARVMQLTGRGTILGDRTAGAVMESRYRSLAISVETTILYGINMTEADLVMADGGRLEGRGVTPDELILPSATDLAAGRDPVLARAFKLAGMTVTPEWAGQLFTN
jgi:carboxyl-terminal processing protease